MVNQRGGMGSYNFLNFWRYFIPN